MSGDPFASLTDTVRDRRQREDHFRRQRWVAFRLSLAAILLITVATGAGAACGGWFTERDIGTATDRLLGGTVCGLAGGVFSLLSALWRLTRRSVIKDVLGERENIDIGATLFWTTAAGTAFFGCLGATRGLTGKGASTAEGWAGAIGATLLALVAASALRQSSRRKSRTSSGSVAYRTETRS